MKSNFPKSLDFFFVLQGYLTCFCPQIVLLLVEVSSRGRFGANCVQESGSGIGIAITRVEPPAGQMMVLNGGDDGSRRFFSELRILLGAVSLSTVDVRLIEKGAILVCPPSQR